MSHNRRSKFYTARRHHQQGSALVIALMVILALTGLGLVGMKHASQEMTQSNNRRYRVQAAEVGDAAMRIGLQRFSQSGAATHDYYMRWHNVRRANFGRDTVWQGFNIVQSSDYGTNKKVFGSREHRHRSFEAQQGTDALFAVAIKNKPKTSLRKPRGEEIGGGKCFWEYTLNSTATVGELSDPGDITINQIQPGSKSQGVSSSIVGPMSCPDVSGN